MIFCNQCGSSSRDMDGFCRGCGAPMSSGEPAIAVPVANQGSSEPAAAQPVVVMSSMLPSDRLMRKNVWVAALLALILGPPGMVYSTPIGALVMSVISIPVFIFGGALLTFLVWPVCIFWAVMAARE